MESVETEPVVTSSPVRLGALDGLRGVAALVVLAHHAMLTFGPLAAPYFGQEPVGKWAALLTYSPAHLVWAGTEAVYLFFVLSGFVLARSFTVAPVPWESYFVSRLVRLYVPVAAAAALAWVTFVMFPRPAGGNSLWLEVSPRTYNPTMFVKDATLLSGTSGGVTPLWSLQWEVLFSVLLPVFLVVGRRFHAGLLLTSAIALSACGVALHNSVLSYLPMFMVGVGLYRVSASLEKLRIRVDARGAGWTWGVGVPLFAVTLLLTVAAWWHPAISENPLMNAGARMLSLVGVAGVVVAAIIWRPWSRLLESRIVQWCGAISFSLYLVHEPLIKAAAFVSPGSAPVILAAIGVSIAVAWVFYVACERPVHRLARRLKHVSFA
jgi:peptidoglycan/LPS O-acetylase OafA/YrhL